VKKKGNRERARALNWGRERKKPEKGNFSGRQAPHYDKREPLKTRKKKGRGGAGLEEERLGFWKGCPKIKGNKVKVQKKKIKKKQKKRGGKLGNMQTLAQTKRKGGWQGDNQLKS